MRFTFEEAGNTKGNYEEEYGIKFITYSTGASLNAKNFLLTYEDRHRL